MSKVYRVMQKNELALLTSDQVSSAYNNFVQQTAKDRIYDYNGRQYMSIPAYVYGYRDMELQLFNNNLLAGSIDLSALHDDGVIVTQTVQEKGLKKASASNLKVGDEIEVISPTAAGNKEQPCKLKVIGILDKMALNYNGGPEKYGIITSEATFKKITGDDTFARFDISVSHKADRAAIFAQLKSIADRVPQSRALDFSGTDTPIMFIETILYGLVTVLSVIGAINIINTISTNLILRLREFGTLRAVGMTMGQMKKMIRLEGMLYGVVGTFFGAIAGGGLARLVYSYYTKLDELIWIFPWQPMVEGAIVAIAISVLATAAPIKRIGRMDVVDAIRLEE